MGIKLFESELKIMSILWENGDTTAKKIAEITKDQIGWSKTTTYTVIKKCIDKGAIIRQEPNFLCHALVTKQETQQYETDELINRIYDGAPDQLVASILGSKKLTTKEIEYLKELVNNLK